MPFPYQPPHYANRNDRGPLRVLFLLTSMPVGGAETLLVNLIDRMDRDAFSPEVCCLKERGPLGEQLAESIPVHANFTRGKLDPTVPGKLTRLMRSRKIDAVITVGCGDKMFWGRLAARRAGVPVVASALHSTGWPDGVGRLNRLLTSITDAFIGCAQAHGEHLVHGEGFPADKVHVIPNGVDVTRFHPIQPKADLAVGLEWNQQAAAQRQMRRELQLPENGPLTIMVAALRPEKNHQRFLDVAALTIDKIPNAQFAIVGEGELRTELEDYAAQLQISESVHFCGNRSDIPDLLRASDVFLLTSDNEAAPVSIIEAMATALPVIASDVGSIHEMVIDGQTGFLVPLQASAFAERLVPLLADRNRRQQMGDLGRAHIIDHGSVQVMVQGYEALIQSIYDRKASQHGTPSQASAIPQNGKTSIPSPEGSPPW